MQAADTRPMRAAEISVSAIQHNVRTLGRHTGARIIVVVKANAYGHGAAIVAPAAIAAGAAMVAVASLDEAITLRESGFTAPILCWLHSEQIDYAAALAYGIELGLSRTTQLVEFAAASARAGVRGRTQLKLDTGLSRNGASPADWEQLFETAAAAERSALLTVSGVLSHLANAGVAADHAQSKRFDAALAQLAAHGVTPDYTHLAASAAVCSADAPRYDTVRVGLAAYGLNPVEGSPLPFALRPALTLTSEVIGLCDAADGSMSEISTGISGWMDRSPASFQAARQAANHRERGSTLAVVPIGYADGMPRALGGTGLTASICGERAPIVGRIGMDECLLDVTGILPRVAPGTRVVFFGDPARGEPAVEEWSARLGTINYEVVAGIGKRVARIAV